MAAEAKFIISAQDKTSSAINGVKKNFADGEKSAGSFSDSLTKFASITAFTVLAKKISDFTGACISDFATAERAQLRLGDSFDRLSDVIDTMGRSYEGSKDDIDNVVSALSALGKSDEQIEAITRASVNLANATGQDLNSSYLLLADTFEGKVSARLSKLIPELGNLTESQAKAGAATEIINERLQDMTDRLAGGAAQRIRNLSEAFGDLKETIGSMAFNMFSPFLEWLLKIIERTNDAIEATRLHQKVMKDAVNASLQERIQDKQNQLDKLRKQEGKTNSSIPDFITWLNNKARLDSDYAKTDKQSMARYATEHVAAVKDAQLRTKEHDAIVRLTDEINELKSQLEKPSVNTSSGTAGTGLSSGSVGGLTVPDLFGKDPSRLRFSLLPGADNGLGTGGSLLDFSGAGASSKPEVQTPGFGFNPFDGMGKMGDVITKVVGGLDSFFGGITGMIGSLTTVKAILDPFGVILQGIMNVLGPIINDLLTPLIGILTIVGEFLGTLIAPALKMLAPVITFITEAFIWVYNKALVPFQNGMIDIVEAIANFFIDAANGVIRALNKLPFVDMDRIDKLDLSNEKLKAITGTDVIKAGGGTVNSMNNSSSGGATYTGSQNITINIYQNAPLVGSNGMKEFTLMLRDELDTLGYYNQ